ncbi:aerotaxis sensor receptor domain protein [Burkholderia pseudomallei]|nr:aerotaxis sensor receptor domain protein [Burkholderia pseudomallei]
MRRFSSSAVEADSCTSAAFCCVILSNCVTATLTWPMPSDCSRVAEPISPISPATCATCERISFIASPA